MYSLDEDVKNDKGGGHGIGVFQPGINVRFMNLKGQSLMFKILPAYDPTSLQLVDGVYKATDPKSWVPFRDPSTHALHVFARKIRTAGWVGHGRGKDGRRRDLLSPKTFESGGQDGEVYCPLTELFRAAENDARWDYLTKDKTKPDGTVIERSPLSFPTVQLLVNLIDCNSTQPKCELGVFSSSACNSLLSRENPVGLAWQTANISDPAYLQQNPLMRWATGDLTSPEIGPVLTMTKGAGQYGKYSMQMAKDAQGNVIRVPVPDWILEQRYNLLHLESVVKRQKDEDLIRQLVKLLNGVNPTTGEHEWVFLKHVFGNVVGSDVIPDPPAQGYTQGFTAPQPQQQQGWTPPGMQGGMQQPQQGQQLPPVQQPQQQPQQGSLLGGMGQSPPPMQPPGAQPMVQSAAPSAFPTMDNPGGGAPATPPVAPPSVPPAAGPEQSLMSQANTDAPAVAGEQPAPQPSEGAPEGGAPVPGDAPPAGFQPSGFMDRLNDLNSGGQ
jgi:hypothetical protein